MKKAIFFCSILLVISLYTDGFPSDLPNSDETVPIDVKGLLKALMDKEQMELGTKPQEVEERKERKTGTKKPVYRPPKVCISQGRMGIHDQCKSFYVCERPGATPIEGDCKDGKHFDHHYRECKNITVAACKATQCDKYEDTFADPYHRENYLSCKNLYPEVTECPQGQVWDDDDNICKNGDKLKGYLRSDEDDSHPSKKKNNTKTGENENEGHYINLHPCKYGETC